MHKDVFYKKIFHYALTMECALHISRVRDTVMGFPHICRKCWIFSRREQRYSFMQIQTRSVLPVRINEKGCCSSFSLVEAYDNAVLELCGLENGQIMEFDDFTDVVQKKILASGKRKEICGNCQWNSICESQKSRWEKC